jgi:hypothetical protein
MKKLGLILLMIVLYKFSFAQKINLPDSLPFTLEYIDSTTFANAKSLNAELIRDTSNFEWHHDSLFILDDEKEMIYFFIDSNFTNSPHFNLKKAIDKNLEAEKTFEPYGYVFSGGIKYFLVKSYCIEWCNYFEIINPISKTYCETRNPIINFTNQRCFDYWVNYQTISIQNFSNRNLDKQNILEKHPLIDEQNFKKYFSGIYEDKVKWVSETSILLKIRNFKVAKNQFVKLTLKH